MHKLSMLNVLISYDITSDRRRTKVARLLEGYGDRVQYSVFEVTVSGQQLENIIESVTDLINLEKDSVRFYNLCAACSKKAIVVGPSDYPFEEEKYVII